MEKRKDMAALGIFLFPMVALSLIVIPWAIFAPASFCPALDPNLHPIMDGWGGDLMRLIFFHCDVSG